MKSLLILTAVCIAVIGILIYQNDYIIIEELDLMSYILAKSTLAMLPKNHPFPKNETGRFEKVRSIIRYQIIYGLQPLTLLLNPSLNRIHCEDVYVPVDHGKDSILLRIYNHYDASSSTMHLNQHQVLKKKKVLVFYHGGGFIFFSTEELHTVLLNLAKITGYVTVSVDYRLAPEHVFPTAINDAYEALEWVMKNIDRYGGDGQEIIVAGESAGGNLAAAVTSRHLINKIETICDITVRVTATDQMLCQTLHERDQAQEKWHEIIGLWLIYPVLDASTHSEEAKKFAQVNGLLTLDQMEWMRRLYQGSDDFNPDIRYNYQFSPLYTPNLILSVYPPTLFTLAEHDILTAESYAFIERLRNYLRSVHSIVYSTTIHAFFSAHPFLGPNAMTYAARYMEQAFH